MTIWPFGVRTPPTLDKVGAVSTTCRACCSSADGPVIGADSAPAAGAAAGALVSGVGSAAEVGALVCATSVGVCLEGTAAAAGVGVVITGAAAPAALNLRS